MKHDAEQIFQQYMKVGCESEGEFARSPLTEN